MHEKSKLHSEIIKKSNISVKQNKLFKANTIRTKLIWIWPPTTCMYVCIYFAIIKKMFKIQIKRMETIRYYIIK